MSAVTHKPSLNVMCNGVGSLNAFFLSFRSSDFTTHNGFSYACVLGAIHSRIESNKGRGVGTIIAYGNVCSLVPQQKA